MFFTLNTRRPLCVLLAATATTLMLEAMRVFVSYTATMTTGRPAGVTAATGGVVVLLTGLAAPLIRWAGVRRTVLAGAGILGLSRLAIQFTELPLARAILGAAGVACWSWAILGLLAICRQGASTGVVAGLGLDLAIRVAFGTMDLPWMPGPAAHAVTLLLALALVPPALTLLRADIPAETSLGSGVSLLAVGPGLAFYHLVSGNLGLAQVKLGVGLPAAAAALALGTLAGVTGAALMFNRAGEDMRVSTTLIALPVLALGALSVTLFWLGGQLALPGLVGGVAASTIGLVTALRGAGRLAHSRGVAVSVIPFTAGIGLELALLFAYYATSGSPLLIGLAGGALALGALARVPPRAPALARPTYTPPAALAVLLFAACGWQLFNQAPPGTGGPAGPDLTVMTYNIQSGFALDGTWSLERTARTIEAERADIVVLQEVGRGLLLAGDIDEALWLSRRLRMTYAFGAASDDGLWGNMVLSRLPILGVERLQYTVTRNRKRAVVAVHLQTSAGDLWVLGTHLAAPKDAGRIRRAQVSELLALWPSRTPALILGDLNADPDGEELGALRDAGFVDTGRSLGPDAFTSEDRRRIDYILATPDVQILDVRIPPSQASDHRPVVARVRLRPLE